MLGAANLGSTTWVVVSPAIHNYDQCMSLSMRKLHQTKNLHDPHDVPPKFTSSVEFFANKPWFISLYEFMNHY